MSYDRRDRRMAVDTFMKLNGRVFWRDNDGYRRQAGGLDVMEYGETSDARRAKKRTWRAGQYPTTIPESQKIDRAAEEALWDQRRSYGMAEHELKCWPEFFGQIIDGTKRFEYRKDDRGFRRGDILIQREWSTADQRYTGRELQVRIKHIWRSIPGLPLGFCIMSIDFHGVILHREKKE